MENSEEDKNKEDIKRELISKELTEVIKGLLACIGLAILFGYAGFTYCVDNNEDVKHGIVFGSIFPFGIALMKGAGIGNGFTYVIYTIAYICLVDYVPTFVGYIILFVIVAIFILWFIRIERKDRTDEISKINNRTNYTNPRTTIAKPINKVGYSPILDEEIDYDEEKEFLDEDEKLECECERCFKKISYEEYELNDFMCEDCYQEVHTDKHGNFHDDEYFDF